MHLYLNEPVAGESLKFKTKLDNNIKKCQARKKCRVTMIPRAFMKLNLAKKVTKIGRVRGGRQLRERIPKGMELHDVKFNCTICQDDK